MNDQFGGAIPAYEAMALGPLAPDSGTLGCSWLLLPTPMPSSSPSQEQSISPLHLSHSQVWMWSPLIPSCPSLAGILLHTCTTSGLTLKMYSQSLKRG